MPIFDIEYRYVGKNSLKELCLTALKFNPIFNISYNREQIRFLPIELQDQLDISPISWRSFLVFLFDACCQKINSTHSDNTDDNIVGLLYNMQQFYPEKFLQFYELMKGISSGKSYDKVFFK